MSKRRMILAGLGALVLIVVASLWAATPTRGPLALYAHFIPNWQIDRAQDLRRADGPAARAMLATAARWPVLAAALRELDRRYPDDVLSAAARVNQAARESGLPYWLEMQTIKGQPMLLTHTVKRIRHWHEGNKTIEVLHLRRLDHLNVEMGLIGQASGNGPLVFLDRIEDEWVEDLSHLTGEIKAFPIELISRRLIVKKAKEIAGPMQASFDLLRNDLSQRRLNFNTMQDRMNTVVPRPSGLVWSAAWFERIESLTTFSHGHGPLVFDSDLREVRQSNRELQKSEFAKLIAALVDLRADSVEAHEVRHAIERAAPPMPPFLRHWGNQDFADQINKELRAYLGELHDSPQGPCLSLVALIRAAYSPKARATPHFFAGRILARGLTKMARAEANPADSGERMFDDLLATPDEALPDVDPNAFMEAECATDGASLRQRTVTLWRGLYGEPMPELSRVGDNSL